MIIDVKELKDFCTAVFEENNVSREDAIVSADVLVTADMRGIPSHGVARLSRYISGIKEGLMKTDGETPVERESPVSLVVDARGALGAPVSRKTMANVIDKAQSSGMAMGVIKNSNHYGIAGYYAMMALEHDMLGFSMTNTAALGVPTFGKKVMFGTNPLAFAAPAQEEKSFVLDMSTTAVTRGKVEVYNRDEKPLLPGWAVDSNGNSVVDAGPLLDDMFHRRGGGLVPLGGDSEVSGGHKGYGLAVMVDIMTGLLSGSQWGSHIFDKGNSSARVSHFFGAVKIDLFCDALQFRHDMDAMLKELRSMEPSANSDRVYYAGLKEQEAFDASLIKGIDLSTAVIESLQQLAVDHGMSFPTKK